MTLEFLIIIILLTLLQNNLFCAVKIYLQYVKFKYNILNDPIVVHDETFG